MPLKDKQKQKEYDKEYKQKNKERIKEHDKEYYENNKEYIKKQNREYNQKNKERIKQYTKEYLQTEHGKKIRRIRDWKKNGIITDNYDFLYDWYISINNCLICDIELVEGSGITNRRHLDHSHKTGEPCIVVCGYCNLHILK